MPWGVLFNDRGLSVLGVRAGSWGHCRLDGRFPQVIVESGQLRLDGIPYLFCLSLTFWICARYLPTGYQFLTWSFLASRSMSVWLGAYGSSSAMAVRLALLRLRDCRCFSAQERQRVWPAIAGLLQFLQRPSNLACRRRSCW